MNQKHENNPGLEQAIKDIPKDALKQCAYCNSWKTNLRAHRRVCKKRPKAQENVGGAEGGCETETNDDFIKAFKERLKTHSHNLSNRTINDYAGHVKKDDHYRLGLEASFSVHSVHFMYLKVQLHNAILPDRKGSII